MAHANPPQWPTPTLPNGPRQPSPMAHANPPQWPTPALPNGPCQPSLVAHARPPMDPHLDSLVGQPVECR
eukprot:366451-Chlamydomonas_euryale.AAC.6